MVALNARMNSRWYPTQRAIRALAGGELALRPQMNPARSAPAIATPISSFSFDMANVHAANCARDTWACDAKRHE